MKKHTQIRWMLPWIICGLGALFYSYEYFLRITPSVMTVELKHFFHIKDGALGSLSAYYYYIYTPMQLAVGLLMDRYGPRRLLTIATLCCVAGSLLFAATPILFVAEMGRFLIGFGSAFAFVGVMKLATIWLPRRYFAMFAGLATSMGMIGAIIGDNLMTAMKQAFGWQETVFITAVFGVLLALAIGLFVRDKKLFEPKKLTSKVSLNEAFKGLRQIALTPQFWIIGFIGAVLFVPITVFAELWGVPYLQHQFHLGNAAAASAISLVFAGFAVGGPIYGWIAQHIRSHNKPLIFACIATALVMFALVLLKQNVAEWLVFVLLFTLGMAASGQSIVFAVGKEIGPQNLQASSLAFVNMAVMLGGALLQPAFGYLLQYNNNDFRAVLVFIPVLLILAIACVFFILKETGASTRSVKPGPEAILN